MNKEYSVDLWLSLPDKYSSSYQQAYGYNNDDSRFDWPLSKLCYNHILYDSNSVMIVRYK